MRASSRSPAANGGALLALDLFALLVTLMAGRVIPAFIANAVPAARPRRNSYVEIVAFGTLAVLLVAGPLDPWLPGGPWLAGVAALGALAHSVRLWLWDPAATRREPLLWVLPLSYAWLPAALILRALWLAGAGLPAAAAFHALRRRRDGRADARDDDAERARPHRPAARRTAPRSGWPTCWFTSARRFESSARSPAREAEPPALAASAVLWSGGFALFFAAYFPVPHPAPHRRGARVRRLSPHHRRAYGVPRKILLAIAWARPDL